MVAFGSKVGTPKRIDERPKIRAEISLQEFYRKENVIDIGLTYIVEYADNIKVCIDQIKISWRGYTSSSKRT